MDNKLPFKFAISPDISVTNDFIARREVFAGLDVPVGLITLQGQWVWENAAAHVAPLLADDKAQLAELIIQAGGPCQMPAYLQTGGSVLVRGLPLRNLTYKIVAFLGVWGIAGVLPLADWLQTALLVFDGVTAIFANSAAQRVWGTDLIGQPWWHNPVLRSWGQAGTFLEEGVRSTPEGAVHIYRHADYTLVEQLPSQIIDSQSVTLEAVAQIVHEIRNPLAAVGGYVDLAVQGARDFRVEGWLTQARTEIERLTRLTEDLLWVSRPVRLTMREMAVDDWVHAAWTMVDPALRSLVTFTYDPSALTLWADPDRLHQALLNILKNAAEAVDPEIGTIRVEASLADRHIWLRVRDNGPGIPPAVMQRLLDQVYTSKTHGNGLGLLVSRRLIDAHGGQMTVMSGDHGTTVTLILPQRGPTQESEDAHN